MVHLNAFSLASFVSGTISACLALYAWRRRREVTAAPAFALSMLAVAVWSFAYGLELGSGGETEKIIWAKAAYLGALLVPPSWLACVRRYAGRPPLGGGVLVLMALEPLVAVGMLATNDAHHLFWAGTGLREVAGRSELVATYSLGAWVNIAYSYALIASTTVVLLRSIVRSAAIYRAQAAALLLAVAAPWLAHIGYVLGYEPFPGLELTSFAFTVTGISMAYALFRLGFFEVMPVAQSSIVARMRDGIVVINEGGIVAHVNPAAEEMLEVEARAVVGRRAAEAFAALADLVEEAEGGEFEGEVLRGSGELQRRFEVRVVGLDTAGRACGRLVVLRDVTLAKHAELALLLARDEAVAAARSKAEFLATMSHEIRTPMNGVIGTTEILMATPLDHDQRDLAGTIRDSANALLGIINSILDFSKIEAGRLELEEIDFEPRRLLEDLVGLFGPRARNQGIELLSSCPEAVPTALRGDAGRLRQVLSNLISNAVKFTAKGSVSVRCELGPRSDERTWLRIAVTDTGIGVVPEQQGRLFEAFVQADSSMTRRYGGTGLGLAISKRLVELMGGEISFASQPGMGSTFEIVVPFSAPASEAAAEVVDRPRLAGELILLLDARTATRRSLEGQLRSWGAVVDTAEQVGQAVAILRTAARQGRPFGWIFVDMSAAGDGVVRLLQSIRADAKASHAHVVLLTDVTGGQQVERLQRSGLFEASLPKPLRESRLRECVLALLRGDSPAVAKPVPTPSPRAPAAIPATVELAAPGSGAGGRARILVVEDNIVNQKVAMRLLSNLGHAADLVADGAQAVEATSAGAYDLIFMDCQMPVMDGFQATAEIRRREAGARRIAIVAMTANAMEGDRDRCIEAGMDDYVAKPVRPPDLAAMLTKWLAREAEVA